MEDEIKIEEKRAFVELMNGKVEEDVEKEFDEIIEDERKELKESGKDREDYIDERADEIASEKLVYSGELLDFYKNYGFLLNEYKEDAKEMENGDEDIEDKIKILIYLFARDILERAM